MPMLSVELSDDEARLLDRRCKHEHMTRSEYVRYVILFEGLMAGDNDAFSLMRKRLVGKAGSRLAAVLASRGTAPGEAS